MWIKPNSYVCNLQHDNWYRFWQFCLLFFRFCLCIEHILIVLQRVLLESFKVVFLPLWLPYPLASWIFSLPMYLSQLVVFFLIKPCNMGLTIIYWSQNRLQWKSSQFQKLACNHAVGFQCLISWLTVSHHYSCGTLYITSWSYLGFR